MDPDCNSTPRTSCGGNPVCRGTRSRWMYTSRGRVKAWDRAHKRALDFRLLYMHGRNDFTTAKKDLVHLRSRLKSGGLLLADACCEGKPFDAAFRKFTAELFGDDKLKLE